MSTPDTTTFLPPPPIVAIDFDGVIHKHGPWTGEEPTGPPVKGIREFVAWLKHPDRHGAPPEGYRIVVFSCRALTLRGRRGIEAWLRLHGIDVDEVTCIKPHAILYIDDRAARFNGSWDDMRALVVDPTPHKAEGEDPVRFVGVDLGTEPDYTAISVAAFDPKCGTCSMSLVAVVPNGQYDPCGHKAPGTEAVE